MSIKKNIAIVGAGPVGSLLSIYLAKRGHEVNVYERREDMRLVDISAGRSINLAISDRGLKAIDGAGYLNETMGMTIPMKGRTMHSDQGEISFHLYGQEGQAINSISRGGLNAMLMDRAEQDHGVKFHFDLQCKDLDLEKPELFLQHARTGEKKNISADLIFAADGAFSAVRNRMLKTDRFDYHQFYLDHAYKELVIPPKEDGTWMIDKNSLHIWPRKSFMLIALPNLDGSFTVTLFLAWEGEYSFENLNTDENIKDFFETHFADALAVMPTLVEDFKENPASSLAVVKCYPWVKNNKVALIGDAAHAIVPFYGQGMIAGFEDCTVLEELMEEHGDDWDNILEAYQVSRKPDGDAIANLALKNFIEMRDKVGDEEFLHRKHVEKLLMDQFPGKYVSQYSMVSFSHTRYSIAWEKGNKQEELIKRIMQIDGLEDRIQDADVREKVLAELEKFEKEMAS